MAEETSAPVSTESPTTPKKASPKKTKKAAKQAAHPATATMVNSAIENLKERGGSSLQAIKKYISSTYDVDAEKYAPYIRKYLKASVVSGFLIQTKGKGASGSFKIAGAVKKGEPAAASDRPRGRPKKASRTPSPRKSPVKKATKAKKEAAPPASPKKAAKAKAPKSPSKAKKTAKSPTRKPKSPKPKTTKRAAVAKSPRKAASPKKK